jgi:PAS domain-containing protein
MSTSPSLARPEIQAELISEALASASVGFLVWGENRRYIAANAAACEILGTTLEELLGREVGAQTVDGAEAVDEALASGFGRERPRCTDSTAAARSRPSTPR